MTNRLMTISFIAAMGCSSAAMAGGGGDIEQRFNDYGSCLTNAAVQASYSPARNDEIFGIARAKCSAARARLADVNSAGVAAADATWAARMATAVDTLRYRRRLQDGMYGLGS